MKILVVNQPLNNRGDESAHKGLVRRLVQQHKGAQLTILFVDGNDDSIEQFKVHAPNVLYLNIKSGGRYEKFTKRCMKFGLPVWMMQMNPVVAKIVSLVKESDCVLCAPGGICMGGFQNWGHLSFLYIAKGCGSKIIYYGRSFGPFPEATHKNRRFKSISYSLLHYFDFLSVRDSRTQQLAEQIGAPYKMTTDSAFLDSPCAEIEGELLAQVGDGKYIVFVPNLLNWHYAYRNVPTQRVVALYKRIVERIFEHYPEHRVVMLPQTFNYGVYHGDDINFFRDLASEVADERLVVVNDTYSSDVQQSVVRGADLVVGARYHSIVFALNNNVPFIALSYEHKIAGLLDIAGESSRAIDICDMFASEQSENSVVEQFERLLASDISRKVSGESLKQKANECFEELRLYLDKI